MVTEYPQNGVTEMPQNVVTEKPRRRDRMRARMRARIRARIVPKKFDGVSEIWLAWPKKIDDVIENLDGVTEQK